MKKSLVFGLLFLVSGVLSACMDIRAVDKDDEEGPTSVEASPGWPAAVRAAGWNGYRVSLPADVTSGTVRKSRWQAASKAFSDPVYLPVVPGTTFVDADVKPGEAYAYEWGTMRNGRFEAAGRKRVAVPLDLEIKDGEAPTDETKRLLFETERFGTLIVGETTILTEGRDLRFVADEIRFNGAAFRSFEPGAKAADGKHGRSGGRVLLRAPRISGAVRFELRGEHGGDGLPGRKPGPELAGLNGIGGTLPSRVGGGWSGGCIGGSRGTNGGQGKRGHAGGNGGNGGDSGEVVVQAGDRRELQLETVFDVGNGGIGGPGGEGGAGGEGAPVRGTGDFFACPPGEKGDPGDRGPTGETGAVGARGRYLRICYVDPDRPAECR